MANSDAAARLRGRIREEVDGQPTMAAAYRTLKGLGLESRTQSAYYRRPQDGQQAVAFIPARELARIGSSPEMGLEDCGYFAACHGKLTRMQDQVRRLEPQPIKTGGRWLRV